jgi:hypothetical protein
LQQGGNLSKLNLKSCEFIFVGIADGTKGYRYYNTTTCQILTSWNVVFLMGEEKFKEVEVTHPMQLEGESGNGGKQSLGGESNQAQAPETETETATTPHASETHHAYLFIRKIGSHPIATPDQLLDAQSKFLRTSRMETPCADNRRTQPHLGGLCNDWSITGR